VKWKRWKRYAPIGEDIAYPLNRQTFEQLILPDVQKTVDLCCQLVNGSRKPVNQVLMVGGSCRIPYIRQALEKAFNCPVARVDDPELAVCYGAALKKYLVELDRQRQVEKLRRQAAEQRKQQAEAEQKRLEEARRQRIEQERKLQEEVELKLKRELELRQQQEIEWRLEEERKQQIERENKLKEEIELKLKRELELPTTARS
jgi:molecular chaperone DnaK